eukprot:CAMPEP_0181084476 /NCGR_PEP_ID=MMETSP1071-20121207/4716_1 /TAXON_ID=35127 /ORGANISM="Thalassiosira sp., Strain NH16" /LENGTH=428 /DNA_ID=CAMNT_0023166213 /DNA_START=272 /DNA_END=1558 /DNA_ORIENTATION=+
MRMNRFVRPQIFRAAPSSRRIASTNRGITSSCASSYPSSRIIPANDIYRRDITRVYNPTRRLLSSSASGFSDVPPTFERDRRGKRVWKASRNAADESEDSSVNDDGDGSSVHAKVDHWDTAVDDVNDRRVVDESLSRICEQEREGGRMKQSQMGVLREDPHDDMRLLLENYTAAALASALRDREDTLQHCATLIAHGQLDELSKILRPYEQRYIVQRRHSNGKMLDFAHGGFDNQIIELLRKGLNRMPRRVSTAHSKRAGVVLPLCNVDGVPCILFEKRSRHLRAHPDEVCLPGGMVSEGDDKSIVQTCLREMEEEIGIGHNTTAVLGVLRCNWGEVHHLVGVAVTPVVCFLGEIGESELNPNPSEVAECFTVPLESFLDRNRWVHKKHYAPFFTGGPHIIWGLTGYIVNRFVMDIIERYDVVFDDPR